MLPSWRNKITITLSPTFVKIVAEKRGRKKRAAAPVLIPLDPAVGRPDWTVPLAAFEDWLKENQFGTASATVIVADCYARYALVPWPDGITNQPELDAYSQIHFEELFSGMDSGWCIQTDWRKYGASAIGCALERAFVEAIRQVTARRKMHLSLVQPNFVHAYNRFRDRLEKNDVLFAVVNVGQCTFAGFRDGKWKNVRTTRGYQRMEADLPLLVEREILLQGLDQDAHIFVYGDEPITMVRAIYLGDDSATSSESSLITPADQASSPMSEAC